MEKENHIIPLIFPETKVFLRSALEVRSDLPPFFPFRNFQQFPTNDFELYTKKRPIKLFYI